MQGHTWWSAGTFLLLFRLQEVSVDSVSEDPENEVIDMTDIVELIEMRTSRPPHFRCAAHCLGNVAIKDSEEAMENVEYQRISQSVVAKCQALFNEQKRSTQAADAICNHCNGNLLVVPNLTRWNSSYESFNRLNNLRKWSNYKGCNSKNVTESLNLWPHLGRTSSLHSRHWLLCRPSRQDQV